MQDTSRLSGVSPKNWILGGALYIGCRVLKFSDGRKMKNLKNKNRQ
jgi:hypothetical protein